MHRVTQLLLGREREAAEVLGAKFVCVLILELKGEVVARQLEDQRAFSGVEGVN